jgi:hypothetical protein
MNYNKNRRKGEYLTIATCNHDLKLVSLPTSRATLLIMVRGPRNAHRSIEQRAAHHDAGLGLGHLGSGASGKHTLLV